MKRINKKQVAKAISAHKRKLKAEQLAKNKSEMIARYIGIYSRGAKRPKRDSRNKRDLYMENYGMKPEMLVLAEAMTATAKEDDKITPIKLF